MTLYDFTGLTPAQQRLMSFQGWEGRPDHRGGPRRKTVDPLIARGFLVEYWTGGGYRAYIVPVPVHMAWCDYCSRQNFKDPA